MTNRAQAKPTKDPRDPIQQQSLVGPAFLSALAVVATIAWLLYDDFWATKPWKQFQNNYQAIAVPFLAEQYVADVDAISEDDRALTVELQDLIKQLQADPDLQQAMDELGPEIEKFEIAVRAVDGLVGDRWWKTEQASESAAMKYQKEHGNHKWDDAKYRAVIEEVIARTELTVRLKLMIERLKGRSPELTATISRLDQKARAASTAARTTRQALESFNAFNRDWVQVYKRHTGSNDIVDRCESCHRGNDESYLSRDKMWSSHLSNDKVRDFVEKSVKSGKNYYEFKQARLDAIFDAELAQGASSSGSFFKDSFEVNSDAKAKLVAANAKDFMAVPDLAEVEKLIRTAAGDDGLAFVKDAWNAKNAWRSHSALAPWVSEPEVAAEGEEPVAAPDPMLMSTDGTAKLSGKYGFYREPGTTDAPSYMLTAEVLLWLATEGPYRLDGHMKYPDRFGVGTKPWFRQVANDPRVLELYQNLYKDFRAHIKEELLMFTAHPRRDELLGTTHAREEFGCMSCHRGFGLHGKSVRDAHGKQAHWLVPLFKEGYQEAGCQKCHKKDIELAGATRIQKGKDLYQDLGCWGCHSYEGYEGEAGEKLRVAKAGRDVQAEMEALAAKLAAARAAMADFAPNIQPDGTPMSNYAYRMLQGGMTEEAAEAAAGRAGKKANDHLAELERQEGVLRDHVAQVARRSDELDREHKRKGPTLMDLSLKTGEANKGWVANWIRYPKAFRPSTKMPHFWYGPLAFVDEKEVEAAGGKAHEAFGAIDENDPKWGNPLERLLVKQQVDKMKMVIAHTWQASRVAADLELVAKTNKHNVPVGDPQAIADGRMIFTQGTGCMSCHGVEPDLVKGTAAVPFTRYSPGEEGADSRGYVRDTRLFDGSSEQFPKLWMAAPKYDYRVDRTYSKDGHDNYRTNEFIYSTAANLSRVGEKADPDYLVEWVLQPRLRNKHSIMPSFMAEIAGLPAGAERDAVSASIAQLQSRTDPAGKLLLADARRRRGDITPDAIASYRAALSDAALKTANVPNRDAMLMHLENALKGYERAKLIVAYLMSLKNPELSALGHQHPENGWMPNYSYTGKVWTPDESSTLDGGQTAPGTVENLETIIGDEANRGLTPDKKPRLKGAEAAEARGILGLKVDPKGEFVAGTIEVEGFGDYSFMDEGYDDYKNARTVQRVAGDLKVLSDRVRDAAVNYAHTTSEANLVALRTARAAFMAAYQARGNQLNALANATGDNATTQLERDLLNRSIAQANAGIAPIMGLAVDVPASLTRADAAKLSQSYATISVNLNVLSLAGRDYEGTTFAGKGRAYTAFYGCAGCHQIEGMETEGKIGVELTEEGSKFIQRLDFGMLEHHPVPEDKLTPEDPTWMGRGSLRTYDPSFTKLGDYRALTPETLPQVRGGIGFELPPGIRNRYIRSKYDYHTRPSWFQGKLHNPRQWDKQRLLAHEQGWFERTRMPLFELNEEELLAITAFIEGSENLTVWGAGGDDLPAMEYIYNYDGSKNDTQAGWWIINKYRCTSCHTIGPNEGRYRRLSERDYGAFVKAHLNGDDPVIDSVRTVDDIKNTPPILGDAGSRVQGDWMVNWLREPYNVRNLTYDGRSLMQQWVQGNYRQGGAANLTAPGVDWNDTSARPKDLVTSRVIMPQFYLTESEARTLQRFFANMAGAAQVDVPKPVSSSPEAIAFGEQIFLHGACLSCHGIDEQQAGYYAPGGMAPNLRQVPERVRRDWVSRWVKNPDAIQPKGRMYHYFRFDIPTQRWVVADTVNNADYRPRTEPGNKNTPLNDYKGDHVEALVAWLYEGLPNQRTADLLPRVKAVEDKQAGR